MSEEGVSIKAKNRIKKMTKLKILEKGQKLAKHKNWPWSRAEKVTGRVAGRTPGAHGAEAALPGLWPLVCGQIALKSRGRLDALERKPPRRSPPSTAPFQGEGRRHLLPRGDGGPARTLRPASPDPAGRRKPASLSVLTTGTCPSSTTGKATSTRRPCGG